MSASFLAKKAWLGRRFFIKILVAGVAAIIFILNRRLAPVFSGGRARFLQVTAVDFLFFGADIFFRHSVNITRVSRAENAQK